MASSLIELAKGRGRKPLLYGGLVGMTLSMTILGVSSALLATPKSASDPEAIITLLCLAGWEIG